METRTRLKLQFWMGVPFVFALCCSFLWVLNIKTPVAWGVALAFFAIVIVQHLSPLPRAVALLASIAVAATIFARPDLARTLAQSITLLIGFLLGSVIAGAVVIGLLRKLVGKSSGGKR